MLQYADDIAAYITSESIEEGKIGIEIALKEIDKRLNMIGLELELTKTNIMVFNNKKDKENKIAVRIKEERVGNVRAAKFLGVVFDSILTFDRHVTQMVEKSTKSRLILCVTYGKYPGEWRLTRR